MAGLQRSTETFRRSGSSGLVWEDRFSGNLNQDSKAKAKDEDKDKDGEAGELGRSNRVGYPGSGMMITTMDRSQSNGARGYRTGRVSPALDPPSPKLSGCGFCGVFGKPANSKKKYTKTRNRAK